MGKYAQKKPLVGTGCLKCFPVFNTSLIDNRTILFATKVLRAFSTYVWNLSSVWNYNEVKKVLPSAVYITLLRWTKIWYGGGLNYHEGNELMTHHHDANFVPKGSCGLLRVQLRLHGAAKSLQDGHQQICSNQGKRSFVCLVGRQKNIFLLMIPMAQQQRNWGRWYVNIWR